MALRRAFLFILLLAILYTIGKAGSYIFHPSVPCFRCNIIIIVVDSLRANELPCYGYTLPTAPKLCAYAKENTLFTRAYANATWTRPSNMSIITSLYPSSHGMVDPISVSLNPNIATLPQVLQKNGYTTRFVANDQIHMGIELGYERIFQHLRLTRPTFDDITLNTWLNAIDAIKQDNAQHKPSFTYFHTDHVHNYVDDILHVPTIFPLDPTYKAPSLPLLTDFTDKTWIFTEKYLQNFIATSSVQALVDRYKAWLNDLNRSRTKTEAYLVFKQLPNDMREDIYRNMTEDNLNANYFQQIVPLYRHLYDESIRTFDEVFAKILERIEQDHLSDNTIIVIVSDHGQMLGEHSLLGHILTMDKQEIAIPLIIHAPGIPSQISNALTQHIDIFPTVLDLVGIPIPQNIAGISHVGSLLDRKSAPVNTFVISQTTIPNQMSAIITDRWKLMEAIYPNGTYRELYDLFKDPNETHSIASSNESTVERLTTLLHTTLNAYPIYPPVASTFPYWKTNEERSKKIDREKNNE